MLPPGRNPHFLDKLNEDPTTMTLLGLALAFSDDGIRAGFRKHLAPGKKYAPDRRALDLRSVWVHALRSLPAEEREPNYFPPALTGLKGRSDALYRLLLYLSVPLIRARASQGVVDRDDMSDFEDAFERTARSWGVEASVVERVAWARHEAKFEEALAECDSPSRGIVDLFWSGIVKKICPNQVDRAELESALYRLVSERIANPFGAGYARNFPGED